MKRGLIAILSIGALIVASNVSAQVIVSKKKVTNKITAIDPVLIEPGQGDEHLCHATIVVYRYPSCKRGSVYSAVLSQDPSNPAICDLSGENPACHSEAQSQFIKGARKLCSKNYLCGYTPGIAQVYVTSNF